MGGNMVGQIKNVRHLLSYCYLLIWFENVYYYILNRKRNCKFFGFWPVWHKCNIINF